MSDLDKIDEPNDMKNIMIDKVVVNIGVGKSGDPLERAKIALEEITGKKPAVCGARRSVRDFGIHKGEPIGTIVTLRRDEATTFLKKIFTAKANSTKKSSIDNTGNLSIGIKEHIDIPGTKYNPDVGIFGMNVCISLKRPGYRISKKRSPDRIGKKHRISQEDSVKFFQEQFGVKIV